MKITKLGMSNPVPFNLIMCFVIAIGVFFAFYLKREAFPSVNMDTVIITVDMNGSTTPDQVDSTVNQLIYSQIENIDGVKKIESIALENAAIITVDIDRQYDINTVKQDIKDEIDMIQDLPEQAEAPRIILVKQREIPIFIAIYGDEACSSQLREAADFVEADLKIKGISSRVRVVNTTPKEVTVSISAETLRAKNITIPAIANQLREHNFELSSGKIITENNTIIIKGPEEQSLWESIGNIPIKFPNGEWQQIKDLANTVIDGFSDDKAITKFNGKQAAILQIEKSDKDDTLNLCADIRNYVKNITLPYGLEATTLIDISPYVQDRLDLIKKNGLIGLCLVLLILSLFLEWRVAVWVATGIAFSLIGTLGVLYLTGNTINMISLFGFLVTLGIVVDDAIVIGENFFHKIEEGFSSKDAAIATVSEISWPVIAMMTTTIVAFCPLLFLPGAMGKFIYVFPCVVISALTLSLIESLFLLPIHLGHHCGKTTDHFMNIIRIILWPWIKISSTMQPMANKFINILSEKVLAKTLRFCITHKYATAISFLGILIMLFGLIPAGIIKTAIFPPVDMDFSIAQVEFDHGTPSNVTEKGVDMIIDALHKTNDHIYKENGFKPIQEYCSWIGRSDSSNTATLFVKLSSSNKKQKIPSKKFQDLWRSFIPDIHALSSIEFSAQGPHSKAISIDLISTDTSTLKSAESELIEYLHTIRNLTDIHSSDRKGGLTAQVSIKNEYNNIPISEAEILKTIASAYHGITIDAFYRSGDEIKVIIKAPMDERTHLAQLRDLPLPNGMPVGQVANIDLLRSSSKLIRIDGRKTITIDADVDTREGGNAADIRTKIEKDFLTVLPQQHPKLTWAFSGEAKEGAEIFSSMIRGFLPALFIIYFILATIFRSYIQPIIIMVAIPFSFVGAIIGHGIMNIPLSVMSGFGIVALAGIAVNDSLVLIDCINTTMEQGVPKIEALILASKRRFRPILLTSLTTIAGMSPVLLETSVQAQFLIPMVTSLVFGIAFSTVFILILIPVCYSIIDDLKTLILPA